MPHTKIPCVIKSHKPYIVICVKVRRRTSWGDIVFETCELVNTNWQTLLYAEELLTSFDISRAKPAVDKIKSMERG